MFVILRRIQRDVINVKTSSREVLVIFVGFLIEFEFSQLSSDKCSKIKFYQNPSSGSKSCSMRTDRHDEANFRFSQFCERAWKCLVMHFDRWNFHDGMKLDHYEEILIWVCLMMFQLSCSYVGLASLCMWCLTVCTLNSFNGGCKHFFCLRNANYVNCRCIFLGNCNRCHFEVWRSFRWKFRVSAGVSVVMSL